MLVKQFRLELVNSSTAALLLIMLLLLLMMMNDDERELMMLLDNCHMAKLIRESNISNVTGLYYD